VRAREQPGERDLGDRAVLRRGDGAQLVKRAEGEFPIERDEIEAREPAAAARTALRACNAQ
jgi:hypothetical protein